jgi:hypothetical protein
MNPHADPRELCRAKKVDNQRIRCADCGRREEENDQRRARCKTLWVLECGSGKQAAARQVPGLVEHKLAQRVGQCVAAGRREKENDQ